MRAVNVIMLYSLCASREIQVLPGPVRTVLDDNKRLTIKDYREVLYQVPKWGFKQRKFGI